MVVSASDNGSAVFDHGLGNFIVENPLVDAENGLDAHADHDHVNVAVLKNKGRINYTQYDDEVEFGTGPRPAKTSSKYIHLD